MTAVGSDTDAPVAADATPKRRRLPGVNLRPGSVKQARVESGLSLAQLGVLLVVVAGLTRLLPRQRG